MDFVGVNSLEDTMAGEAFAYSIRVTLKQYKNFVVVAIPPYAFFFASSSSDFGTLTKAGTTTLLRFRIAWSPCQQMSTHLKLLKKPKVAASAYLPSSRPPDTAPHPP
jgi:hypothetical protein